MIAKGLHFLEVTLVGVLNSDAGLNIPDFRASENVFQLVTQVAGRSGRGVMPGEVIIQTALPDNFSPILTEREKKIVLLTLAFSVTSYVTAKIGTYCFLNNRDFSIFGYDRECVW